MNPQEREKLIGRTEAVFRQQRGFGPAAALTCREFEAIWAAVDAVLAVLQQDKEPYDGEICGDCGLPVARGIGSWWHAPDELWNEICAGSEILCPACFYERALKLGKSVFFVATVCQDKTTEDQVVSAEGSPAVDSATERLGTSRERVDDVTFAVMVHRLQPPKPGGDWLVRVYLNDEHIHSAEGGVPLSVGLREAHRAMERHLGIPEWAAAGSMAHASEPGGFCG